MAKVQRRAERNQRDTPRTTFSLYLDRDVIAAVDTLVTIGRYPNRSDAVESAIRRLVIDAARESLAPVETVAA
jgi:Arc/MetJ-type ribon-helix-helix transcriptional regulator